MNTVVSLEIAKLLKKKGFDAESQRYYCLGDLSDNYEQSHDWNSVGESHQSAPIIADVVMWLLEKYDIWIYLLRAEDNKDVYKPFFSGKPILDQHLTRFFESTQLAYETAIKHTLNELVK